MLMKSGINPFDSQEVHIQLVYTLTPSRFIVHKCGISFHSITQPRLLLMLILENASMGGEVMCGHELASCTNVLNEQAL